MTRKMFCFNRDGVAEWIIAESREQALEHYVSVVGQSTIDEAFKDAQDDEPGITFEDFLDNYIEGEPLEKEMTLWLDGDQKETKTVREFCEEATEVPTYFACEEW